MLFRVIPLFCVLIFALAASFNPEPVPKWATYVPEHPQRPGDPEKGYEYLVYGDYVSTGSPLEVFRKMVGKKPVEDLGRTGINKGIPYPFNAIVTSEGAEMVAPTCLSCHAEYLMDTLIVGLGNNTKDYTKRNRGIGLANAVLNMKYGKESPEMQAFERTTRAYKALAQNVTTDIPGPNPADKVFAVLAAHRNPVDMTWLEEPQFFIPEETIPTDVPPWWHVKKKHMLYHNGIGRGDFARLSMASGMLTMVDSSEAREIDHHFPDVMAWIRTIEPPAYPFPIDAQLAAEGQVIFEKKCSKCHGKYGEEESYPNLIVDLDKIGTDPMLAKMYQMRPEYHNWYNSSWFAEDSTKVWARLWPNEGYVAPPLDGIWASAPYLHNASVPTVWDMLDSKNRPDYWERSFESSDYDPERLGWKYERHEKRKNKNTYDTTLPGYGNQGHPFGDKLTDEQRKAVVEYLKTL